MKSKITIKETNSDSDSLYYNVKAKGNGSTIMNLLVNAIYDFSIEDGIEMKEIIKSLKDMEKSRNEEKSNTN